MANGRRYRSTRGSGKVTPVSVIIFVLILVILIVTAVVCLVNKAAVVPHGAIKADRKLYAALFSWPVSTAGRWA
ncbi:MAG: hypothetical protein JO069_10700 [Verrucomicrobia bacterium]|nr:hypothetical protein [Verrucomicrobiota bacterium]